MSMCALFFASSSPLFKDILNPLNWLFSAALGAVFYVLFTALDYVQKRTYDPRYNSIYMIRFVLGVLAGLILATVTQNYFHGSDLEKQFGPAVLALLGGFSTEAVYQVLQRFVDILLSAIRGDNSGAAQSSAVANTQNELLTLANNPLLPGALQSQVLASVKKLNS